MRDIAVAGLWLPLRLGLRDLRGGFAGFRVFIACIILGVAAIVGVGSTARALLDSLAREGQRILGGDVAFTTTSREIAADERAWLLGKGAVSEIANMRAMARKPDGPAVLVEIKAVDSNYPSLGTVETRPEASQIHSELAERGGSWGIYGDAAMQARLALRIGDRVLVGDRAFVWRGVLKSEPDRLAGGMGLGPRILMSADALRGSGLIQPGSLVRWTYRLILPAAREAPVDSRQIDALVQNAEKSFPEAGWRIATRNRISQNFSKNLERFTQFLTLVGLTALAIGGIGMANAVRGFVDRKRNDFAIMKAVGASGSYVFMAAMIEVLLAACVGVIAGAAIGLSIPYAIKSIFALAIPVPFEPAVYPIEIGFGIVYGLLASVLFSTLPLAAVHDTPVSRLFRESTDPAFRPRLRYIVLLAATIIAFLCAILIPARDFRGASIFLAAAIVLLLTLQAFGLGVTVAARNFPRARRATWRLAMANLGRPRSLTRPVIASVGLGLSLFVALSTIDVNIRGPLQEGIPGKTPTFFFTDIQGAQGQRFETFIRGQIPDAVLEMAPMLRGRIIRINETEARAVRAKENVAWVLEGDRGITFANEIPAGSRLTDGAWWTADYRGEPLVSVEAEVAQGLGLKIGDRITVNILGRNITARIANLREVNWRTYGINFVLVFNPATFSGAPYSFLATATFDRPVSPAREAEVVSRVASAFPTVTSVRLKETLDAVADIARQLGVAIRSTTIVTLIASILVLAGALAASQSARIYDLVILKTLGATRRRIFLILGIEFAVLGLMTSLFALVAGTLTGWAVLANVLNIDSLSIDGRGVATTILAALSIVTGFGLLGTWRMLTISPAKALRNI